MAARRAHIENYDDVPLSALLQAARRTYANAARRAQSRAGCTDLPATGEFIINTMHWSDASLEAVVRWMGVTKQAVSQAVDTLVLRGYLERSHDPRDRRRVRLTLTDRGRTAGRAARSAIDAASTGSADPTSRPRRPPIFTASFSHARRRGKAPRVWTAWTRGSFTA